MMRLFWKSYLGLLGWNTAVSFPYHHLKKYIIIVGPHTSNWDFVIGLAYRSLARLNHVKFLGKKELFKPPFGFIFSALGGIPVDRKSHNNLVDDAVRLFNQQEEFAIALAPEGTRKKVDKLKTGFYFIAHRAGVPVIMVGLDYKKKVLLFSEPFVATGDLSADMEQIMAFYGPIQGKYPAHGLMHT